MKIMKKVLAGMLTAAMLGTMAVPAFAGDESISLTLWGAEEDQALLKELVEKFEEQYADFSFDIRIGVESESTAKDTVLTDIEAAADVFAFASDQIFDLQKAGALATLSEYGAVLENLAGKTLDDVKAANAAGAVSAATVDGELMAFPMSADNSFFLYYDKSLISDEEAASWDTLLDAAEKAGKKVGYTLASGWYNSAFFYGAGLTTELNADGTTAIDWNAVSPDGISGVDVTKAMLKIAAHPAFQAVADGDLSNQIASGKLCAVASGTWDASAVQKAFGDGYAASKLPAFTAGDKAVEMAPPFGYKFVGVNAYAENIGWAILLADFLTNEESQVARFLQRQIGPSNLNAAAIDEVQENIALAAVVEEGNYGIVQMVGGKFWDPTATFGEKIAQGTIPADDDAAIQAALDSLVEGVTAPIE